MGKYFGTDGFRGEANVVLTVEHAFKVGRFLGWYYGREHKARVVIGKDTRRSSYMYEDALSAGLTSSGADVYLLHVTTTPSVSYVTRTEDFDCGIMISASHNPFYDNGIKVINAKGHKLEAEVEEKIESYLDGEMGEIPYATGDAIGRTVDYAAGRNRYIGHLIAMATRSFKDKRVGLDCSNGSASSIAKSVFDALGAKTYVINSEPDGTNINRDCGSTHIEGLQAYVKEHQLDVGFAYDGDADRCLAVDENGNLVVSDRESSQEVADYIASVSSDADVQALIADVDQKCEAAKESDPALKEFMESSGSSEQEDSSTDTAPSYLMEQILDKADSGEVQLARAANKASRKIRLLHYSLQTAAGVMVALLLLFSIPNLDFTSLHQDTFSQTDRILPEHENGRLYQFTRELGQNIGDGTGSFIKYISDFSGKLMNGGK